MRLWAAEGPQMKAWRTPASLLSEGVCRPSWPVQAGHAPPRSPTMARAMERPKWRSTLPILSLYLAGIGLIRQIEVYAGDPEEERDCPVRADGSPVAEAAVATVTDAPIQVVTRRDD